MKPKISVIVPIYNVEPYFKQCVDSIRNQTLKDIEIILVDDGSPDHCPEMCDQFAKEDKRIRVIHQKNQGVSAARNNGLKTATGEWISFCDPDDWMGEEELEYLYSKAVKEDADIVICGHYDCDERGIPIGTYSQNDDRVWVYEGHDIKQVVCQIAVSGFIKESWCRYSSVAAPWGSIYRAEIVSGITFSIGIHPAEDLIYNIYAHSNSKKTIISEKKLHYYRSGMGAAEKFSCKRKENTLRSKLLIKAALEDSIVSREIDCLMCGRELRETVLLVKFYFFHPNNLDSYFTRREEIRQYIKHDITYLKTPKNAAFVKHWKSQIINYLIFGLHLYWPFEVYRLFKKIKIKRRGKAF